MDQLYSRGVRFRKVPLLFAGGNVTPLRDTLHTNILSIGTTEYIDTKQFFAEFGKTLSEREYCEMLKTASTGTESVLLIGPREQGEPKLQHQDLFHIDQVILPLTDGVCAVARVERSDNPLNLLKTEQEDKDAVKTFITTWKDFLLEEGMATIERSSFPQDISLPEIVYQRFNNTLSEKSFIRDIEQLRDRRAKARTEMSSREYLEIVNKEIAQYKSKMPTMRFIELSVTPDNVHKKQSYTNGIVYRNKYTNRLSVIMPIFPGAPYNERNKLILEQEGIDVTTVTDYAHRLGGNLHCLTIRLDWQKSPHQLRLTVDFCTGINQIDMFLLQI